VAQENTARDETVDQGSPERFINRELSWLAFNERVLAEADNPRQPLLERLRFLSISANNLDEFYMVRVAGLKGQVLAGIGSASEDGLSPAQQLDAIGKRAGKLMRDQAESLKRLRVELAEAGLCVVEPDELSIEDRAFVAERFWADIFPVLTPLAVDPAPCSCSGRATAIAWRACCCCPRASRVSCACRARRCASCGSKS
jgi:polyphosphate kinase